MQHDEFIGHVQHEARLASRGDAERATRATLETLAERLEGGLADNVAAQLPQEIGRHLLGEHPFHRYDSKEFFRKISEREHEDLPAAIFHAQSVLRVLREAVTPGAFAHLADQLPEEFVRAVFEVRDMGGGTFGPADGSAGGDGQARGAATRERENTGREDTERGNAGRADWKVDEASQESFPASDPPSY